MKSKINEQTLREFVNCWKIEYESKAKKLRLFTPNLISWDSAKKAKFAKIFYHARGNFFELIWFLGSLAPTYEIKKTLMKNIAEELGGNGRSHEQYYFDFANELGVDCKKEILQKEFYIDSVRNFNHNFLKQVINQKYSVAWSIYSAYELLDNIDYTNLLKLVQYFGVSKSALRFFMIHAKVAHFETTEFELQKIWEADKGSVLQGFDFIMTNQLEMWRNIGGEF